MLEKYRETIASLPHEEAEILCECVRGRHGVQVTAGPGMYDALATAGLDQADLIMCLAHRTDPRSMSTVQHLLGCPISVMPRGATAIDPVTNRIREEVPTKKRGPKRDDRIVTHVAENPKRPGTKSHERYALWRVGAKVSELLQNGLTAGDVAHDVKKGFVKLDG